MGTQEAAIEQLGKHLGLDLSFDDHDQCLISLDKNLFVSIKKQPNGFLFYGMLSDISGHREPQLLKSSLSLNLRLAELDKGTIALDAQTNVAMLVKSIRGEIDLAQLEEELGDFAHSLEHVMKILAATASEATIDQSDFQAFA